jgi:hypothetical protein
MTEDVCPSAHPEPPSSVDRDLRNQPWAVTVLIGSQRRGFGAPGTRTPGARSSRCRSNSFVIAICFAAGSGFNGTVISRIPLL